MCHINRLRFIATQSARNAIEKGMIRMRWVKRVFIIAAVSTFGLVFSSTWASARAAKEFDHSFPLNKGTYWIYRGPVESGENSTVLKKTVDWKMEVTDIIERQDTKAAVVKGFPQDLWWYSEKNQRGDYLIIQVFPARFYLVQGDAVKKALDALRDSNNILQGLVQESQLFLEFPLIKNQRFGETELITRTDWFYCWVVGDEHKTRLEGVKGIPNDREWMVHTVTQFTVGSHEEFDFVSGIGITRYMGHHNGTVSDFELKLVEFHPGNE